MFHFPKTILGLEDLPSKMNALYLGENYDTTMLTKKNTVSRRKEKFLVSIGGVKIEAEKNRCEFTVVCFKNLHCALNLKYLYMLKTCLPANRI